MTQFHPMLYPIAGVGIGYNADIVMDDEVIQSLYSGHGGVFDYIEVQPSHFILFPELLQLAKRTPMLMHCSQFSLATQGIPMDQEFLKLTKRIAKETNSPWFAEHISLTRFRGGDTRHFFLPYIDEELIKVIASNARSLCNHVGIPLLLENAPRIFSLNLGGCDETSFIREVIEESDTGFLLDISSAVVTAERLGYDLWDYIRSLPLDRLIEVHVGDLVSEWDLLEYLLQYSPVKAVTLEANLANLTQGEQAEIVEQIKPLLKDSPQRWTGLEERAVNDAVSSMNSLPSHEYNVDQVLAKVDETARFSFGSNYVVAEQLRRGIVKKLPLSSMLLIRQFTDWKPLSQAFYDSGRDMALNFALVRELISCGILAVDDRGISDTAHQCDKWETWGSALTYHLESRTRTADRYLTLQEQAEILLEKAKHHPPPPSFKDYSVHPIYALNSVHIEDDDKSFLDVLLSRRTRRSLLHTSMDKETLSKLLYLSWGYTGARLNKLGSEPLLMKTSPSGGSLHSVEVYPVLLNVEGLPRGVYHYSVRNHCLEMLSRENPHDWLIGACGDQEWVGDCSAVFVMTSVLARMAWKYDFPRAYRIVLFDVGHLSQTFTLVATWLGLGSFVTGALRDEVFEERLGVDCLEEPVFLVTGVGGQAYS